VYYISEKVVDVVSNAIRRCSGAALNVSNRVKADEFRQTLASIAEIELNVFPNEVEESCALVELVTTDGGIRLGLSYPEEVPDKNFPTPMTISGVPMWADDFTRIFRLPYWQPGQG